MNFLHFAVFLFAVCSVVLVLVSLATKAPAPKQTADLTFQTVDESPGEPKALSIPDAHEHLPSLQQDPAWRCLDLKLSVLLVALVGAVWLYFTG